MPAQRDIALGQTVGLAQFDIQTLSVVTVYVTALRVFAGVRNRAVRAPMLWGAACIVGAAGLALLTTYVASPDWVSVNLANALCLRSCCPT